MLSTPQIITHLAKHFYPSKNWTPNGVWTGLELKIPVSVNTTPPFIVDTNKFAGHINDR